MAVSSYCRRAKLQGIGSSLAFGQKEAAALFSKPPQDRMGTSIWLLYDGFFSFAVVRQIKETLLPQNNLYVFWSN